MSERPPDLNAILDDAWSTVVGGMDWLKSVVLGEFADHQSLSTIIAQMLVNFMPGVVIVTSARDAVAVILRLAAHPEKREDLMEWVVLSACLIVLALPIVMAAGGAVVAGVGAVVGGIAGSELGAALRGVLLLLIKQTRLVDLIRFLQKFIKGDVLKFLRAVDFVKYEKPLLLVMKKFTGKLIEIVRSLRLHLESLRYFDTVKGTILKLAEWERRFYAVQEDALKQMPKALTELQARLVKLLAQTVVKETHMVPAGVAADKTAAVYPAIQRVRDTPGNILAKVEDEVPAAGGRPANEAAAKSNPMPSQPHATQPEAQAKPPLKDKPEPLPPHQPGENTKKQAAAKPTDVSNGSATERLARIERRTPAEIADRERVAALIYKARAQGDPGVPGLISKLERNGVVVKDTNHYIGSPLREVDIETSTGTIVQVKKLSSAQKVIDQIHKTEEATGQPTVGFVMAQHKKANSIVQQAGRHVKVTNDFDELLDWLK